MPGLAVQMSFTHTLDPLPGRDRGLAKSLNRPEFVMPLCVRQQTLRGAVPYNPVIGLDSGGAVVGRKTRLPGFAIQEGGGLFNV